MAIERHAGLQAKRIAGAQAAGAEAERRSRGLDGLPDRRGRRGIDDQFHTILAGVAGAAHGGDMPCDYRRCRAVVAQAGNAGGIGRRAEAAHDLDRQWPLHGDHGSLAGAVGERDARGRQAAREPGNNAVPIAGVDDQRQPRRPIWSVGITRDERVVEDDRPAFRIARDERVANTAHFDPRHFACQQRLQPLDRCRAADRQPSHVRHVEHAGSQAGGQMLLDDRRILDGHPPAGKIDHAAAVRDVPAHQGCFEKQGFFEERLRHVDPFQG